MTGTPQPRISFSPDLAQQLQCPDHPARAGLLLIAEEGRRVQEVQLHQIEAPLVKDAAEGLPDVGFRLRMIEIQRVKAAPIAARRIHLLPVTVDLLRMIHKVGGFLRRAERREPQAGLKALRMDLIHQEFHPVRELFRVRLQPVADRRLPAVIDLEEIPRL